MQTVFSHRLFTFSFFCCSLLCKISISEYKYKIRTCIWKMWLGSVHLPACILFSLMSGDSHFVFMVFGNPFALFWETQYLRSLLENIILQEDTGKTHSFNQLNAVINSYSHIICKPCVKAQHKPFPGSFCLVKAHGGILHIFQDEGFLTCSLAP